MEDDPSLLLRLSQVGRMAEAAEDHKPFDNEQRYSSTQPPAHAFTHQVRRAARLQTFEKRPTYVANQYNVLAKRLPSSSQRLLRTRVFDVVKLRLKDVNISVGGLDEQFFSWMLPKDGASMTDWNELIHKPYLISNTRLSTMINMRRVTRDSTKHPTGSTIFYVRTFAFTVIQFVDVLQEVFSQSSGLGEQASRLYQAIENLNPVNDALSTIYIRYCGMTTQPSAWIRHVHDLSTGDKCFKTDFLQTCQRLYPEIITAAEVHEFNDGMIHIPLEKARQRIADVREQAIIALFGPESLLNILPGGFGVRFIENEQDDKDFGSFRTNTYQKLQWYTRLLTDDSAIRKYARDAQSYAQAHPVSTGHSRFPVDDAMANVIMQQAVPSVMTSKCAVMVTVGSDLTADAIRTKASFYSGGVISAEFMMDVLDNLVYCELGYRSTATRPVLDLQSNGHLPFVDLYPWAIKADRDFQPALKLLRTYLQVSKPYVVLTFSDKVSSTAVGNFQHKYGLKGNFTGAIGIPVLANYDETPSTPSDENNCIVIPSFHPGFARYCEGTPKGETINRLISKTLAVVWLTMDRVITACQVPGRSKREVCESVIAEVAGLTGTDSEFGQNFSALKGQHGAACKQRFTGLRTRAAAVAQGDTLEPEDAPDPLEEPDSEPELEEEAVTGLTDATTVKARAPTHAKLLARHKENAQFKIEWKGDTPVIQAASVRWSNALEELDLLLLCDVARGEGWSNEREAQATRLTGLALPYLPSPQNNRLKQFVKKTTVGQLFYFAYNNTAEMMVRDIPNLLSLFLNDDIRPDIDEWRNVPVAIDAAASNLLKWIEEKFLKDLRQPQQQIIERVPTEFQELLHTKDPQLAYAMRRIQIDEEVISEIYERNGQAVKIQAAQFSAFERDRLVFKWQHSEQEYDIKGLYLPRGCLPIFPGETRTIHFVPEGIDIRDSSGRSMSTSGIRRVTLPLSNLVSTLVDNPLKTEFIQLWERETGLQCDDVLFSADIVQPATPDSALSHNVSQVIPKSFFTGRSEPFDSTQGQKKLKINKLQKLLPFQPGDAGWLINRFLEQYYPNGGEVNLVHHTDELFNDVQSMWVNLQAFLQNPLYKNHPQRASLRAAIEISKDSKIGGQGKGAITGFTALMNVLRPPCSDKLKERKNRTRGLRRAMTVVTIAANLPANTVVPDVPPTETGTVDELSDEIEETDLPGEDEEGGGGDDAESAATRAEATSAGASQPTVKELAEKRRAIFAGMQQAGGTSRSASPTKKRGRGGDEEASEEEQMEAKRVKGDKGKGVPEQQQQQHDDDDDEEMLV